MSTSAFRLVLDTNVVVRALINVRSDCGLILRSCGKRRVIWFAAAKRRMIVSMLSTSPILAAPSTENFTQEVLDYCDRYQLLPILLTAARLASEVYASARHIVARMQADPETDETRVVVDVAVTGEADAVLRQKGEFTKRWVQLAPPEVRDRIRVLYHFN